MTAASQNHDPPPAAGHAGEGGYVRDIWRIEPMPAGLIDSPLDFIFAEHHRQREAAVILMMIADGGFDRRGVGELVRFLETDFLRHLADEEDIFFPALRRSCAPADDIDALTARLSEEHKQEKSLGEDVIDILNGLLSGAALSTRASRRLRHFSRHVRQHLALENGILLPIARVRLTQADQRGLAAMLNEHRRANRD